MFACQQAMAQPDKPAIIMPSSGETVSFGEYEARSNRVARFLRDAGLRRGEHIAVFIENSLQLLEIEGGAERTGVYYTLINAYLGAEEVAYVVANSRAKVLFSSAAKREVAEAAAAKCPGLDRMLMTGPGPRPAGWEPYGALVSGCPAGPSPRRIARRGHAVLVGHDRPAQGNPARSADSRPRRAVAGDGVRAGHVRVPRGHDLPQPGTAASLGSPRRAYRRHCAWGARLS